MEYEGFLIVSYFLAAGLCAAIGWSAYAYLRRPMRAVLGHLVPARTGNLLGWSFPLSTILHVRAK
jgi:hypothetical protein